mmetsp:Transcript_16031/g.21479  ORF Transcript_16031/g.21479 Transcript_16031/m.21479 type:complete len:118 (+) Transcript_16031:385-738(+)
MCVTTWQFKKNVSIPASFLPPPISQIRNKLFRRKTIFHLSYISPFSWCVGTVITSRKKQEKVTNAWRFFLGYLVESVIIEKSLSRGFQILSDRMLKMDTSQYTTPFLQVRKKCSSGG